MIPPAPSLDPYFYVLSIALKIFNNWGWFFLPFLLWKTLSYVYLFHIGFQWNNKQKRIVLEVKIPKETVKPIRAMEDVFNSVHGAVYHPPDWWEKWVDGQVQMGVAFEITSFGGEPHFYIRTPIAYRDSVEASVYAQFPEAELIEVDDYTKYVPQSLPNKEWGMWATDYKMLKDDHYPIKTYPKFETEHEVVEEKRIDPVAILLEAFSKVKPGEQFWIQIMAEPTAEKGTAGWLKKGEELRDKLSKRPTKPGEKSMVSDAARILIEGKPPEEVKEEESVIPPEMRLTPGEKDVLIGVEKKMGKPLFVTHIRFIYLGKREVWFKANFRLAFAFFNAYTTLDMNSIFPLAATVTKIHKSWFLPKNKLLPRRLYIRSRRLFRNYKARFSPFFPRRGGTFIMNAEELASLFHFPGKAVAPNPSLSRMEAKKGGAPSDLPVE